jgi:hypothetical protein
MRISERVDYPVRETVKSAGGYCVHLYYFVGKDSPEEDPETLGAVEIGERHIHFFVHEEGVFLLRTDGRAPNCPAAKEGASLHLPEAVTTTITPYLDGDNAGQLIPTMAAPMDIQLRWYEYLLDRRREHHLP